MIFPQINKAITPEVIAQYYQDHLNEFQTVDRVQWQDIFVAVGEKHPTMAHARQFAQQIVEQWKQGADINKLLEFDDGSSRSRQGMGVGELKGDIRPCELEAALFTMQKGEIGPLYEMATGIHIFRVVNREIAGPMPFDQKIQLSIGNKLKGEMFELERKCMVRELRDKATIVISERPTGQ
jgi:hypothetical protein